MNYMRELLSGAFVHTSWETIRANEYVSNLFGLLIRGEYELPNQVSVNYDLQSNQNVLRVVILPENIVLTATGERPIDALESLAPQLQLLSRK